jgi:hypothetical protein
MGTPFSDISLYTPIPHEVGTPEYWEVTSLENFVSDLYVNKMNGYKPTGATRITIQPSFHGIWLKPGKIGSIVSTAPYYNYDDYASLDKKGKYKYILDLIQTATLQASEKFNWDKSVFENAYKDVIAADFKFRIDYAAKLSRDKKKLATLSIEKTETITAVYASIKVNNLTTVKKLFEKKNSWWYDCTYILAKHSRWFDSDRFGIAYRKNQMVIWYSLAQDKIVLIENGKEVQEINFRKHFFFQQ